MDKTITVEIHFTNGEKKTIPGVLDYGYQQASEGNYCFYAVKADDQHKIFFPAENINAFGKAGDFKC